MHNEASVACSCVLMRRRLLVFVVRARSLARPLMANARCVPRSAAHITVIRQKVGREGETTLGTM